jgi:short-subunit dehydrogenase
VFKPNKKALPMKKILITGASDGIGLEIARLLAQKGNQLLLVARNSEKLEKALVTLSGTGHRMLAADLSKKEDVHVVAGEMEKNHYDVLVNNAGAGMYGRFEQMAYHDQVTMMNLNMTALMVLSHAYIKNSKPGDSLVNVSSTLGSTSFPGAAVYAATKAFVTSFSESLWWENKKRDVYVLGFSPGVTKTPFHAVAGGSQELWPAFITQTPHQVAQELVQALEKRRKPKAVANSLNRMMLFVQRFMSRKTVVNMMGTFSPIDKNPQEVVTIAKPQLL